MRRTKRLSFLALVLTVAMLCQNTLAYAAPQSNSGKSAAESQEQVTESVDAAGKDAAQGQVDQKNVTAQTGAESASEGAKDGNLAEAGEKNAQAAAEDTKKEAPEAKDADGSKTYEASASDEKVEAMVPAGASAEPVSLVEEKIAALSSQQGITITSASVPAGMDFQIGWVYYGKDSYMVDMNPVKLQDNNVIPSEDSYQPWFTVVDTDICVKISDSKVGDQYVASGQYGIKDGKYYQVTLNLTAGDKLRATVKEFTVDPGRTATTDVVLGEAMDYGILANEMTITGHMETNFATKELKGAVPVNGPITTGSGGYSYIADYTGTGFKMTDGVGNDTTSEMVIYTTSSVKTTLESQQPNGAYVAGGVTVDDTTYTQKEIEDYVDGMMRVVTNNSSKMFSETNQIDVTTFTGVDPSGTSRKYIDVQALSGGKKGTYYLQFDPGEYDNYANAIYNVGPGQNIVLNIPDKDVKLQEYYIFRDGKPYNAGGKSKSDGGSNGYSDYHAQTMIYNCPNATTVCTAGNFDGTVIAPQATYDNNVVGSGWLVVNNFNSNGSEWHLMYGGLPRTDGGSLEIVKTIAGDLQASDLTEKQKEDLKFTVTGPNNYKKVIGYDSFANGKYTLSGIAAGSYTVTESGANITGYSLAVTGDDGVAVNVQAGGKGTSTITNTYTNTSTPAKGNLEITKTIKGDVTEAEAEGLLTFKVTDPDGNVKNYNLKDDFTHTPNTKVYTLQLSNVKPGAYTVEETTYTITGKAVTVKYRVGSGAQTTGTSATATVVNNQKETVAFENDYVQKHAVKIKKTDIGQTKELSGAQLTVTDTVSGDVVDSWKTDTSVELEHEIYVVPGSYKLTEKAAPQGFEIATEFNFTVDKTGKVTGSTAAAASVSGKTTVSGNNLIVMEDDYKEQSVKIKKINEVGQPLSGADLKVTDKDGKLVTGGSWTTDSSGEYTIKVKPGTYTLTETNAPATYAIAPSIVFTVDENGVVTVSGKAVNDGTSVGVVVMKDEKITATVQIKKTDVGQTQELAGAELEVTDKATKSVVDSWTSDGKTAHSIALKEGSYTLTEKAAPSGYAVATSIDFTIDAAGNVKTTATTVVGSGNVIVMEDAVKLTTVNIKKTDIAGQEIAGATLEILDSETNKVVTSWTSGLNGEKEHPVSLKAGNYVLRETIAPPGYVVATAIPFTVGSTGTVTSKGQPVAYNAATGEYSLEMADDYEDQTVKIKKTDIGQTKELSGATLEVWDQTETTLVERWTTDVTKETEHTITVKPGTYTLVEKAAPQGYEIATKFQFTVNERGVVTVNGKTVSGPVVMEDDYADQKVIIRKTDIGRTKELTGATLEVKDKSGNVVETWKTDATKEPNGHPIEVKPGTYTLKETGAPQGYAITTSFDFTVDEYGVVTVNGKAVNDGTTPGIVVMEDDVAKKTVKIKKTDMAGKELPGAKLEVKDKASGKVLDSWTSGDNGETEHSIVLTAGSYTLVENGAPQGYAIATSIDFTIDDKGTVKVNGITETGPIVMADDVAKTIVKIKKTDISRTKEVDGATLQITDKASGQLVTSWISGQNGEKEHTLSLVEGTYILKETLPAPGYVVATNIEFTVNPDQTVTAIGTTVTGDKTNGYTIVMEDDYAEQTVKIKKTDIGQTKELSDAQLKVTDLSGNVVTSWTTDTTQELEHTITLKPGTYKLIETAAPQGFEIATEFQFTVDSTGKVTGKTVATAGATVSGKTTASGNLIVMEDDYKKQEVKIKKTDMSTKKELDNATLQVADLYGNVKDTWTTDTKTELEHSVYVEPGTYILTETAAPNGYAISTSIKFTVDEKGNVTANGTAVVGSKDAIVMEDDPIWTEVKFKKTDLNTGAELAGATLEVVEQGTNNTVASWLSDGTDHSLVLRVGKYTLIEKAAPLGYAIATSIDFTVDAQSNVTVNNTVVSGNTIEMADDYVIADVKIKKTDIAGKELPGAYLKVEKIDTNNNTRSLVTSWISGQGGEKEHTISLPYGDYVLTETAAPGGYTIATEIEFSVDANGKVVRKTATGTGGRIVMEDDYALQDVSVKKTDIAGKELAGADLKVTDKAGNIIEQWTSGQNGEREHAFKVKPGTYTLTETAAPAGYEIATTFQFTVNIRGVVTVDGKVVSGPVVVEDDYEAKDVCFKKTDITGTKEVANATLEITGTESGKTKPITPITWKSTTSVNGKTIKLKPGSYTLKETATPNGYEAITDVEFTIDNNYKLTVTKQSTTGQVEEVNGVVLIKDDNAQRNIYIKKTDITGTSEVANATLEITGSETGKTTNITPISWKSDTSKAGEKVALRPGEYTLKETAAPNGYVAITEVKFDVEDSGKVTVKSTSTTGDVKFDSKTGKLLVLDDTTKVKIRKTDITGGNEIGGAALEIKDANGNVVERWTSVAGQSHDIVGKLTAGATYTLTETIAPGGYVIANSITFQVAKDGKVQTVTMKDDYAKKTFTINLTNKNGKKLSGGKMVIKDRKGNVVYEWTPNGKPKTISLKPGKYVLTEPGAPGGYKKAKDIPFEIVLNPDGTMSILWDGEETDEIVMVDKQDKSAKKSGKASADTGDDNNLMGWGVLGLLSLIVMLGMLVERRRRRF